MTATTASANAWKIGIRAARRTEGGNRSPYELRWAADRIGVGFFLGAFGSGLVASDCRRISSISRSRRDFPSVCSGSGVPVAGMEECVLQEWQNRTLAMVQYATC